MRWWAIVLALVVQFVLLGSYFFLYGMAMWAGRMAPAQVHVGPLFLWASDSVPLGMGWTHGGARATTESAAIWRSVQSGALNAIVVLLWLTPLLIGAWWIDGVVRRRREGNAARRSVAKFLGFAGSGVIVVMVVCILLGLHWERRRFATELRGISSDIMKVATTLSAAWVIWACLTGALPGGLSKWRAAGECAGCGYMRGELAVCPECGRARATGAARVQTEQPKRTRKRWAWFALVGLAAAVAFPMWSDWVFNGMPSVLQGRIEAAVNSVGRWKP